MRCICRYSRSRTRSTDGRLLAKPWVSRIDPIDRSAPHRPSHLHHRTPPSALHETGAVRCGPARRPQAVLDHHLIPAGISQPGYPSTGHGRWRIENNGWMDLTKHWAFTHISPRLPALPKQTIASREREPVSNQGLAAVAMLPVIAFALTSAFVLRHSKLARQDHLNCHRRRCSAAPGRPRLRPRFEHRTERAASASPLDGPRRLRHANGLQILASILLANSAPHK